MTICVEFETSASRGNHCRMRCAHSWFTSTQNMGFSGIVVRSWRKSWQARKTTGEGGRGHVKSNTQSAMRKPLDEHVFVLSQCNVHQFQHICEQDGAHLCCPRCQPETTFAFCTVIQKHKKSAKAQAVQSCAARVWIFGRSQTPWHANTTKQVGDRDTGGNNFGRARSVLSWRWKSFQRHILQRRRLLECW